MPKRNWRDVRQMILRSHAVLARRRICIRAVHHIFHPKDEEDEDGDVDGHVSAAPHRTHLDPDRGTALTDY